MIKDEYLSPIDVCRKGRLSVSVVYFAIYEGKLPAEKVDGHWRVQVEDADRFIAQRNRGRTDGE